MKTKKYSVLHYYCMLVNTIINIVKPYYGVEILS